MPLILRTKLFAPPLRQRIVPRQRLSQRLEDGLTGCLTVVAASAGFGKTTMVVAGLQQWNAPYVWLSLDEEARFAVTEATHRSDLYRDHSPPLNRFPGSPTHHEP